MPLIQLERAEVVFPSGLHALGPVSTGVEAGEFVSLVGPSGCGKSTLLNLLAGLVPATAGQVQLRTSPASGIPAMAFVFQSPTLLTWRTVAGNVRLPLELDGIRGREREERVQHVLDLVGLTEFSRAFPGELSGGMQMRVSLARALVTQPQLLLLDEPFGALDEITRQRLNEELVGLWQRDAWTGVFVTHNVVEAVFLSTRVLVMSRRPGTLVADIPVTLPYPREPGLRTSDEFNGLVASVGEALWSHG